MATTSDAAFIIVTGIPGTGKTSVLKETVKQCPWAKLVDYGAEMLKAAALQEVSRDALRKLSVAEQQEFVRQAARNIAEQAEGLVIIDTHGIVKTPLGYLPGLPDIIQTLKPSALIAVESDPITIWDRRQNDHTRRRDQDTVEMIEEHQALNRTFITACSAMTGALLVLIDNRGELAHAVAQLAAVVQGLAPSQTQG